MTTDANLQRQVFLDSEGDAYFVAIGGRGIGVQADPPTAYANKYAHLDGVMTRKTEWSRMFTWNPGYSLVHREFASREGEELCDVDGRMTVDVLVKDVSMAFPVLR
jgi:hypothetical protein